MKAIRLLRTTMIAGLPRSPAEGIQTVAPDEAKRLITLGMAEDADAEIDLGDDAGDGLDAMNLKKLRQLAKDEHAEVGGAANKGAVIAAIRAKRQDGSEGAEGESDDLDDLDEDGLREIATAEEVALEDGLDVDGIRAAIRAQRAAAPQA